MSITKDQFIAFIEKPHTLNEKSINNLKEIIDTFPFFQSAQILYTYNLMSQNNFRYESYLKTCAIYASDRSILYHLLHPQLNPTVKTLQTSSFSDDPSYIFEISEETPIPQGEVAITSEMVVDPNQSIDFDLISFEPSEDNAGAENLDLIDQFIKINPKIPLSKENMTVQSDLITEDHELDSENEEFITETLSRIYLKQGYYQKAIDSFQRLSLKFPEKSVYFAQQIEEIKKLLN
jgi:tetratricopeptide (TPR) repeat protein